MKIQRVDALPLQLRFTESAVAVLGGPIVLDIPGSCSRRSALIADLRDQLVDDQVIVPLPLSWEELLAWVACVEGRGHAVSGLMTRAHSVQTNAPQGQEKHRYDAAYHDTTHVRALKVSCSKTIRCLSGLTLLFRFVREVGGLIA